MEALTSFLASTNIAESSRYFTSTTPDTKEIQLWITKQIKSADIVMFSKTECKFCQRASRLISGLTSMMENPTSVVVLELNKTDAALVQPVLHELTKQNTVPNIFIGGNHIGGYDKFCEYLQTVLTRITQLDGSITE